MNGLRTLAAAAFLMPGAAFACGPEVGAGYDAMDAAAWDRLAVSAYLSVDELRAAYGEIRAAQADLNGDGQTEICIEANTSATCSMGVAVCLFLVLGPAPERAVLLETAAHRLVADDEAGLMNDWAVLRTETDTGDGTNMTQYIFNPSLGRYDQVATGPKAEN